MIGVERPLVPISVAAKLQADVSVLRDGVAAREVEGDRRLVRGRSRGERLAHVENARRREQEHEDAEDHPQEEIGRRETGRERKGPGAQRTPGGRGAHRPLPTGTALEGFSLDAEGAGRREEVERRTLAWMVVGPLTETYGFRLA